MYISELELHGFKSFAHKTHVKFDKGITAIVGPNGCGKSNIVDALRWVLGEQRPTLLRSSSMSNVIFNGTAKKKALGLADVSLTFVNNKGILPTEYSELTITRRLYRSGDSEYLINDTPCRLKDIMELFMDTGMSSDAYSVIELKMVEEILNDRNNDRRRLFEEAAGVTRYKDQRKRTIRKLEQTMKDLQRLEDILVEVRKKARSLEIQAEKAAKAKKYRDELVTLDKAYNRQQHESIQKELVPLNDRIKNADKEKREISSKLEELESSEEKAANRLIEKERLQGEAQRRVSQLGNSIKEMETNLKIVREKIKNEKGVIEGHEKDIKQSKTDLQELQTLKQTNEKQLNNFADTLEQSENSLQKSKETFNALQQQYTKVRHELYELEISVGDVNKELRELQSDRIKLESKLENSDDDQLRISRDIDDLEDEIENAKGELGIAGKKLESVNGELEELEEELTQVTAKRESLQADREEVREEKLVPAVEERQEADGDQRGGLRGDDLPRGRALREDAQDRRDDRPRESTGDEIERGEGTAHEQYGGMPNSVHVINPDGVERFARVHEGLHDVAGVADADLHAPLQPRPADELAGDLGVVGIQLEGDQSTVVGQGTGHPDGAVPAERADLQHPSRAHGGEQDLQQPAHLGRYVDLGEAPARDLVPELLEHLVVGSEQTADVAGEEDGGIGLGHRIVDRVEVLRVQPRARASRSNARSRSSREAANESRT